MRKKTKNPNNKKNRGKKESDNKWDRQKTHNKKVRKQKHKLKKKWGHIIR